MIEQIGTPEQVYMEPASPFVSQFVGETVLLPGGLHVRPHDIEVTGDPAAEGAIPVTVDNVFRKGGSWRVEGKLAGGDTVVELDLDAAQAPPQLGQTFGIRPTRAKSFTP